MEKWIAGINPPAGDEQCSIAEAMQEEKDSRAAKRLICNGEKKKRFRHEECVDPAGGGVGVKEVEARGSIEAAGGESGEVADAASCGEGGFAGGEDLREDSGAA